jgi:hypothetical protein
MFSILNNMGAIGYKRLLHQRMTNARLHVEVRLTDDKFFDKSRSAKCATSGVAHGRDKLHPEPLGPLALGHAAHDSDETRRLIHAHNALQKQLHRYLRALGILKDRFIGDKYLAPRNQAAKLRLTGGWLQVLGVQTRKTVMSYPPCSMTP